MLRNLYLIAVVFGFVCLNLGNALVLSSTFTFVSVQVELGFVLLPLLVLGIAFLNIMYLCLVEELGFKLGVN